MVNRENREKNKGNGGFRQFFHRANFGRYRENRANAEKLTKTARRTLYRYGLPQAFPTRRPPRRPGLA